LLDQLNQARLVRHVNDIQEGSHHKLILADVEFHPPAPSWNVELIRTAISDASTIISAKQFIRAMYLDTYCQYATLPCLQWRNGEFWQAEQFQQLLIGDYIRLAIPPPDPEHEATGTRCTAAALYLGFQSDAFEFLEHIIDADRIASIPNPCHVVSLPRKILNIQNMSLCVKWQQLQPNSQMFFACNLLPWFINARHGIPEFSGNPGST
jgi:hypothetical protein